MNRITKFRRRVSGALSRLGGRLTDLRIEVLMILGLTLYRIRRGFWRVGQVLRALGLCTIVAVALSFAFLLMTTLESVGGIAEAVRHNARQVSWVWEGARPTIRYAWTRKYPGPNARHRRLTHQP